MITLYTFGPYFGLPDASPFVIKAMLLLKFAGLAYSEDRGGHGKAPKGKLPYINDGGLIVTDSTFVRFHIEKKYGFDFDAGLDAAQKATAWTVEKMCEEHLYWALVASCWIDDANFAKGPAQFFKVVPMPFRPIVQSLVRRIIKNTLKLQGFWRHTPGEQAELTIADIKAPCHPYRRQSFCAGRKALRGGCDGLRLRREFPYAGVRNADPYGGGTARQSHRLPQPDPAASFRRIDRGWVCPFSAQQK
jgi:hypothetical protein